MSLVKAASAWFILSRKSAPETSMPPSSSVGEHTENRPGIPDLQTLIYFTKTIRVIISGSVSMWIVDMLIKSE